MSQDEIVLELEPRQVLGKQVRALRRAGFVPAVIHDHGKPSVHVMAPYLSLYKAYKAAGKHHPLQLKAAGQAYTALIKDITFEPRKHTVSHVVFGAVKADEQVDAEIPIRPRYAEGNEASPAERAGLIVLSQLDAVAVKAIPAKLPDFLEYDAEKLVDIGDHATVADLIVPDGVEIEEEPEHAIATVYEPSALAAANDALAGTAEPEEEPEPGEEGAEATEGEAEAGDAEAVKPDTEVKGE
jgi:large subunit ribosomal protein L25